MLLIRLILKKVAWKTGTNPTKDGQIMVLLKYLSNFCRTLEIPLSNCKINLVLTWSTKCFIVSTAVSNQGATFAITDTKLYGPFLALSTQYNTKLIDQLKSGFKRTINWNKHQSKVLIEKQNQYFDYLIYPSF